MLTARVLPGRCGVAGGWEKKVGGVGIRRAVNMVIRVYIRTGPSGFSSGKLNKSSASNPISQQLPDKTCQTHGYYTDQSILLSHT